MLSLKKILYFIKNQLLHFAIKKSRNIINITSCYKIINKLTKNSIVIDLGTGNNADFSMALIKKFQVNCYGFDPTKKHATELKKLSQKSNGRFHFFPYAISTCQGQKMFYESLRNTSGSFSKHHINIKNDQIQSYAVNTISIDDIFPMINKNSIDLMKIDIEGEEYVIIPELNPKTLARINQLIIEFHHHCIDKYSIKETQSCVAKLQNHGFKTYTSDFINYLFYK